MIEGNGFTFHLDAPLEAPGAAGSELFGWVSSNGRVDAVRLLGPAPRLLEAMPRPDVLAVFPARPFAFGFRGRVTPADAVDGTLRFELQVGGGVAHAEVALPAAPLPPSGWARRRILLGRWAAARRLVRARTPRDAWACRLRILLADIRLARGASFRRAELDGILEAFAQAMPGAVVVQVGANDGASDDPLARHFERADWTGLLVEPVPELAGLLARRHAGRPGIAVEAAAVAESDGEVQIHRIAEAPGDPLWYRQLASLDRSVLLKHASVIPDLATRLVTSTVPALSVATLLQRHRIGRLDLLVIDAEGYDWRILRQFDLRRLEPCLVVYEHQHLSPADKAAARLHLEKSGYEVAETPEGDAIAWV
jgi:FkbM family methyltransferase